jgi:electron transport complex protein RnfA
MGSETPARDSIAFITGGLMALAFMAFDKALLKNLIG